MVRLTYTGNNKKRMKTVSILVPESSVLQAIADPQYCFATVNRFLILAGLEKYFNIELVGFKRKIKLNHGTYCVHTTQLIKEVQTTDLIVIPALSGDIAMALELNKAYIPWIVKQYNGGAEVASLCLGAFLLASTGLLNGKKCSTHWGFTNLFREMFPEVDIQDGKIVTEENGLYSSGGANSYWNLLLYLVEKYVDREMAIHISKYFAIDINRDNQSVFAIFTGQKEHNDEEVKKAQEYIEQNFNGKISIEALIENLAVGRRSFERRFRQATHNSVLEYIQRVKIEAAKRSIENSRKYINEVMLDVGYSDTKAFRAAFKKITGLTPVEYRNRYSKI